MAQVGESPRLVISKAGRYTVFITVMDKPCGREISGGFSRPCLEALLPQSLGLCRPGPVQVPPLQLAPSTPKIGVFRAAVGKVLDAHSRMDKLLAEFLGLNDSKYQWALDDLYHKETVEG
ncbi:uncharacterized protein LOC144708579 [Wolffia australiana]